MRRNPLRRRAWPNALCSALLAAALWLAWLAVPAGAAALTAEEQRLVALYERAAPSVVSVETDQGRGSGFVVDERGYLVTNHHVVAGARRVDVVFFDDTVAEARVVGTDPDSDLAVLKVNSLPPGVRPLPLGDSDALRVGQLVVAIGNPFGLSGTMTLGIVSGLRRVLPSGARPFAIPDVIQTDAAINPGNSGGPLLDLDGQVVGVTTAIRSSGPFFVGVGLAVPVNIVKRVVPALIARGSYAWPWLGVSGTTLTAALAEANGLPAGVRGAYIDRVVEGGPAAKAGLRGSRSRTRDDIPVGGDVVVAVNGQPVRSFDDLLLYITRLEVGQTARLTVLRENRTVEVNVRLEARPAQLPAE